MWSFIKSGCVGGVKLENIVTWFIHLSEVSVQLYRCYSVFEGCDRFQVSRMNVFTFAKLLIQCFIIFNAILTTFAYEYLNSHYFRRELWKNNAKRNVWRHIADKLSKKNGRDCSKNMQRSCWAIYRRYDLVRNIVKEVDSLKEESCRVYGVTKS